MRIPGELQNLLQTANELSDKETIFFSLTLALPADPHKGFFFIMQVSISSKTTPPGHDLKGAKTLPQGQSLCTKTLPSGQNRESKAPPSGQKPHPRS